MSFDIYDVSDYEHDQARTSANEADKVEFALSSGELRQALMERIRNEIEQDEVYYLNLNFKEYGIELDEDIFEDDENLRSVLMDMENVVYELLDEEIDDSIWEFCNESILIRGES